MVCFEWDHPTESYYTKKTQHSILVPIPNAMACPLFRKLIPVPYGNGLFLGIHDPSFWPYISFKKDNFHFSATCARIHLILTVGNWPSRLFFHFQRTQTIISETVFARDRFVFPRLFKYIQIFLDWFLTGLTISGMNVTK